MIIVIVAHDDLLNLTKLAHLTPKVFVECVKVVLQLARVQLVLRVVGWVLVEVRQKDGLRVGGLDVFPRATVAVAARANLVVEGAVDLVLLGTKNGGEVVGHYDSFLALLRPRFAGFDDAKAQFVPLLGDRDYKNLE